jgi:TDG/mug DNA glycosylase family protein
MRNRPNPAPLKPLRDAIAPAVDVLFVGINPGIRSAQTGHHFAGYSNRFWKLLFESGLVPERLTYEDDRRLPEWSYGITNLVARPTAGIDELTPAEYLAGRRRLLRKIARVRPRIVAMVGVTVYRAMFPAARSRQARPLLLGLQEEIVHGARVFVLPNPSGRNANFSYAEMLLAFRALALIGRDDEARKPS